jgi:hypothetical protein
LDLRRARLCSKLRALRRAEFLALALALMACGNTAGPTALAPSAPTTGEVLAGGVFSLVEADAFGQPGFHEVVAVSATLPAAAPPDLGRTLVIRLRDAGRPGQTCAQDHPVSGCATVDWSDSPDRPNVPRSGVFDNSLSLPLATGTTTLFLRANGALAASPEAFDPG